MIKTAAKQLCTLVYPRGVFTTALTASLACIGNIGPGFGGVGPTSNFAFFPNYVKLWLAAVMILGRLEIYTVLILFTPIFYRK